jgi:GTP-binding protein
MSSVFLRSITSAADLPPTDAPHIAVVGRSNVGKSSFVNRLTATPGLAKVSASPGRTRTINLFEVDKRYLLVDLPGYGFARAAKQEHAEYTALIDEYLANAKRIALVILLIDARHGPSELDKDMLFHLLEASTPFVMVANKADKLPRSSAAHHLQKLADTYPHVTVLPCSMETGQGFGEVKAAIDAAVRKASS